MRSLALVLVLTLTDTPAQETVKEWGRRYTEMFLAGDTDELWEVFTPALQEQLGGPDQLAGFHRQVSQQFGPEVELIEEQLARHQERWNYVRTVRFELVDRAFRIIWEFDAAGAASGFVIGPAPTEHPSEHLDYQTRTRLRLPFNEAWSVFWGGRSIASNYHAAYPDQRFALDLLMRKDGATHAGDGQRNGDYYCFGQPIVAPGAGRVVAAARDVPDNEPGTLNPAQALGNHVILDHGNGEYSFLAHFQQGTLAVQVEDQIEAGQLLGLCGNSGNTSEPHLHYHLQTTPVFGKGEGLPSQFLDYVADGRPVERGEPEQGQLIQPAGD